MATGQVLEKLGYEYYGLLAYCKGASAAETAQAQSLSALTSTMTSNYNTLFAGQSNIIKSLTDAFTPITNAGVNQYGFSAAEDAALRTQAGEKTAGAFASSERALQNRIAAQGGGNNFLPSGAAAQLENQNYTEAAAVQSGENLAITKAGYDTGRSNFNEAAGVLSGAAGMLNPTAGGSAAAGAGSSAFSALDTVNKENQAGSFGAIAAGLLGGAIDAGIGSGTGFLSKI